MPSLIILRGLPGAGKSTLASLLSENGKYPVHAIDDYFTDAKTGVYEFRFEENHLAYKSCESRTETEMKKGTGKIFIDNTFTLDWEIEPYFKLAARYQYQVFVLTVENRHGGVNCHGISKDQLGKMAEKYRVKLL